METLLQGYDEQDEDQVFRVCNSPLLKYMDNDVSSLGLQLNMVRQIGSFGAFRFFQISFIAVGPLPLAVGFCVPLTTDPMKLQNVASGHFKR